MKDKKVKKKKENFLLLCCFVILLFCYFITFGFADYEDLGWGVASGGVSNSVLFSKKIPGLFFLNPAASSFSGRPVISAEYENLYPNLSDGSKITRNIFCYSQKLSSAGIGAGLELFSLSHLYSEKTVMVNYSRNFTKDWFLGFNFRFLQTAYGSDEYTENAINSSGQATLSPDSLFSNNGSDKTAFTFDTGVSRIFKEFWFLSGAVSFFTSPDTSVGGGGKRKPTLSMGATFERKRMTVGSALRLEDGEYCLNTGFEKIVSAANIRLRGGLSVGSSQMRTLSIGFGYSHLDQFLADYAFIFPLGGMQSSGGRHRFSLSFMFGKPEGEKGEKAEEGTAPMTETEVDQLYKQAQEAFNAGNWQEAISLSKRILLYEVGHEGALQILSESIKQVKELSQPFIDEGKYFTGKGKFDIALTKFETAMKVNPVDDKIEQLRAKISKVIEEVPQAAGTSKTERLIRMSVEAYINDDINLALNASVYASQIDSSGKGLKILKIMRKEYPQQYREMNLIAGMNLVEQKLYTALKNIYNARYDIAIIECNDAVILEPENALALARLGSAYYALGNKDKAISVWKKALELDPQNKDIREFLGLSPGENIKSVYEEKAKKIADDRVSAKKMYLEGNAALTRKEYKGAAELFKKVVEIEASDDDEIKSCRVKAAKGLEEAEKKLREVVDRNEKQMKVYFGNGMSYYRNGEYEKAISEFEKLLEIDPSHRQSLKMIELCRSKMGKSEE